MTKQRKCVRVVLSETAGERTGLGTFLECLRYAQLVTIHREDETGTCFDIECPAGLDTEVWARHNAERMTSFGYNAVVAPSTRTR